MTTNIRVSFETADEDRQYSAIISEDVVFKEPVTLENLEEMLRQIAVRVGFTYVTEVNCEKD